MGENNHISSLQNRWVKKILALKEKSRVRRKEGLFVIEGKRELQLALQGGFELQALFYNGDIITKQEVDQLLTDTKAATTLISLSKEVYQKTAYRETTEGVLAIARSKDNTLQELRLARANPLILVAEAPEKPGNIGAMLRTADAANLDAVIIADPRGDLYSPNIIRSSVGCIFTTQIATGASSEVISFLKARNIDLYCAALTASLPYSAVDFNGASAIIVGTEATGLTQPWLAQAKANVIIPMSGEIDSMNVSVSAAIIIFEALRQRGS